MDPASNLIDREPLNSKIRKLFSLRRIVWALGVLVLIVLLAACTKDSPQNFLKPIGPIAKRQGRLWTLTFTVATVIFFLVEGALVVAILRFRRKSEVDSPPQWHHNTRVELLWTLVPALILAGIAVPTIATILDLSKKPSGDPLEVTVVAHQWWWEYQYQESSVVTANELHVPVGRPVYFTLKSDDVIHSFWVPKLGGKQDVVPGHVNHVTYIAPAPGEYLGQCVEFCGLSHANMRLRVFAEAPADFDAWISQQSLNAATPTGDAVEGQRIFLGQQCVGCHTVGGTQAQAKVGPNLTHFASRKMFAGDTFARNHDNLVKWLTDAPYYKPGSKMPSGKKTMGLSDSDIEYLIAYLQSLK